MIRQVVDIINKNIDFEGLDVLHGVVYPVLNKTQRIPGDRDGTLYVDAVPNSKKANILYWEDYGSIVIDRSVRYTRFQTSVRLIVWMNFKIMNSTNYDNFIKKVLRAVPKKIGNQISIIFKGQQPKSIDIFSRYDYPEGKQYVAPPYDVAAFDFDIRYMNTIC